MFSNSVSTTSVCRVRGADRSDPRIGEVRLEIALAEVVAVLARLALVRRVDDELVRVAGVLRCRRLAVGPLHVGPDLEGPRRAVLGPRLGESRHRLEVLPEVHEQVVVEREDFEVGDDDRVPRVQDLEVLVGARLDHEVALGGADEGCPRQEGREREAERDKRSHRPGA